MFWNPEFGSWDSCPQAAQRTYFLPVSVALAHLPPHSAAVQTPGGLQFSRGCRQPEGESLDETLAAFSKVNETPKRACGLHWLSVVLSTYADLVYSKWPSDGSCQFGGSPALFRLGSS